MCSKKPLKPNSNEKTSKYDFHRKQSEVKRLDNNIAAYQNTYFTFINHRFDMYSIKSNILFFQYSINQTIFNRKLFQYFKNNPHATKQNLPPHLYNDLNYHDKWVLNKVGHDELYLFLADLLFDYPYEFLRFIISYVGTNLV